MKANKSNNTKKYKVITTQNGFTVIDTNFLFRSDADLYVLCLQNTLNNGGKLIYVADVNEAIEKHNQLEGEGNEDWLRLCWRRNALCYLHTQNIYALKDNSLSSNLDQWWTNLQKETKEIISGIDNQTATPNDYSMFWSKLNEQDKINILQYWKHRKGIFILNKDKGNSLLMEIICELADLQLEKEFNKDREEMCNEDGSFYEEYQDRFNEIYDDIEDRLLNHDF